MVRVLVIIGLVLISLSLTFTMSCRSSKPTQALNEVLLIGYAFVPRIITVPVGTTVTWINTDPAALIPEGHDVTSNGGLFLYFLMEGDTFSYTFTEPGIFPYVCDLHPEMDGRVIVE